MALCSAVGKNRVHTTHARHGTIFNDFNGLQASGGAGAKDYIHLHPIGSTRGGDELWRAPAGGPYLARA